MELTFTTGGREALPLRAIPWVAGHEQSTGKATLPPSLLILSAHTACRAKDTAPGTPLLRLYCIGENGAQPVSIEYLNAIAPESDFQPETDEPLRESTNRLPAGVFVFLDELREFVDWLYPPGCFDGECRDTFVLNTSPDLPAELLAVLLEGFFAPKSSAQAERCNELATLPELFVHHWEELTGAGICEGGSYAVNQDGVFPEKYSNRDLQGLTQEERHILLEHSYRPPLKFPCTPSQLLKFVDGDVSRDFDVPDNFRVVVEARARLVQNEGKLSAGEGLALKRGVTGRAPESDDPPPFCPRIGWQIALYEAWPAMRKLYGRDPTPAEAIKYLKKNDDSGRVVNRSGDAELCWKSQRGKVKEVAFSTVENVISGWRVSGRLPA
jgi:hypothetical protein